MIRAVQYFTPEYLESCKAMSTADILAVFRSKAERENIPYQTQIKRLMLEWVKK